MSPEELLIAQAEMRRRTREVKKWQKTLVRRKHRKEPKPPPPADLTKFPNRVENGVTIYTCPPVYDKKLEYDQPRVRYGGSEPRDEYEKVEDEFWPSRRDYKALCKAANGGSYLVLDNDEVLDYAQTGHKLARQLVETIRRCIRKNRPLPPAWQELLGCDLEYFQEYIEKQFQPGMNWSNWGEWHIDHKKPLASFSLDFRPELLTACNYTNLQPLWGIDNCSKGPREY